MGKKENFEIHKSMYDFLLDFSSLKTDKSIFYREKFISFSKLKNQINKMAGSLVAMNIKKGDVVAVCLPNIPQAIVMLYAINKLGAIANFIHPKISVKEFQYQLQLTNPKLVVLFDKNYRKLKPLAKKRKTIYCNVLGTTFGLKPSVKYKAEKQDGNQIAIYMHSGGTTGLSKTVVLTNTAMNAMVSNLLQTLDSPFNSTDSVLAVLPMYHGLGLGVCVHLALSVGLTSVLVPYFQAKYIVKQMKSSKMTVLNVIPRMLDKLIAEPSFKGSVVKNLKYIFVGGDELKESTKKAFEEKLKAEKSNAKICQGYGLTELATVCFLDIESKSYNAIGKPLKNIKAEVINESGKILKSGTGELVLNSEQIMLGYLKDKITTQKSLIDIGGEYWVRTGDMVEKTTDGEYFFKGRKKRLIKISGMNVFPMEIERVARQIDEIKNCVAIERKRKESVFIVLYIELENEMIWNDKLKVKLQKHFSNNLSHWSIPRVFEIVEKIPYTSFGKVDFKNLMETHEIKQKQNI